MDADRTQLVAVALGEKPAGLVVTNGKLVNVWSGEIYPAGIAVSGNRIAAIGDVEYCIGPDTRVIDANGRYLLPGLIETHMHFGATSLSMTEFARLVIPRGTAAISIDFSEAGRFKRVEAMRVFLDEMNRTPLKPYFSPFYRLVEQYGGYEPIPLEDFKQLLGWPECVELREWAINIERHPNPDVRELGRYAREKGILLAGHLREEEGRILSASVAAGTVSDHEPKTRQEALDRIRLGVAVQIRFGSAHLNEMDKVLEAVTRDRLDSRLMMFSTDEQTIDDIINMGHLDHRLRIAVAEGVAPIDAIRMGTLNAASFLGKTHEIGSLTPGRIAFINLVNDLRMFDVSNVVYGEDVVAENGKYIGKLRKFEFPESFYNTITLDPAMKPEEFRIAADGKEGPLLVRAMGRRVGTAITDELTFDMPVTEGEIRSNVDMDVAKVATVARQPHSGRVGIGLYKGLGLKRGAVGCTYHVNSCNMGVIGMNDADMALVANRMAELGGGLVVAADGQILAEIPMPIVGLVTDRPVEEVHAEMREMKRILKDDLGVRLEYTGMLYMITLIFLPLRAPRLRITIDGLMRVEAVDGKTVNTLVPVVVGHRQ